MVIEQLSILNYKNIEQAELTFSPKITCFVGANGMGKTNVLDALYYLSFCRSHTNPVDAQVVRHGAEFLMLQGKYLTDEGEPEVISCGLKPGRRKRFKRGDKEYRRLIHYGRALQQRNQLLKAEAEPDPAMLDVYEEIMAGAAEVIFAERARFVEALVPLFSRIYARIAGEGESVGLTYESHCARGPLIGQLRDGRAKERIVGYSLHGTHKDDLTMELGGYPVKREGSQGQCKTYLVALKLAQFLFLKQTGRRQTPLLLLDDALPDDWEHALSRFGRIIDVVGSAPEEVESSRSRYRAYRAAGAELAAYDQAR